MVKKIFAVILFVLLFSGVAFALEFSADTITTMKGMKTKGKMYFKPDKFRVDMEVPMQMIMITRIDKKVVWSIIPEEKIYMEMPFDLKKKPMVDEKIDGEVERKYLGDETIDGHPTKKYLVTFKVNGQTEQIYQWWATDIKLAIKSAAVDGSWVHEFKNVKTGPQPENLFELPAGYKKMEMPAGMGVR